MKQLPNDTCCGCGACANICQKNAISIEHDKYGFLKRIINEEKCINCGLCEKVCPELNYKSNNNTNPPVYSFVNKDTDTRLKSASGGFFSALAKFFIESNGIAYGVIFDNNFTVSHARATTLKELEKMYSSKYVQSETRKTFTETKKDLDDNKLVLYSGTPCQIAGLKNFLGKDYENLLTIDLICEGVPTPLLFKKYKSNIENNLKPNEKLLNINFRSKIKGWSVEYLTTTTTTTRKFSTRWDKYIRLFFSTLAMNTTCFQCKYNKIPRVGDITIGDFWGVNSYNKKLNDKKGISMILLNTPKAIKYFDMIKNNNIYTTIPLDIAIATNLPLNNHIKLKSASKRQEFLDDLISKPFEYCVKKYVNLPLWKILYKILIPGKIKNIIKKYRER